jgi:adenylate cyclase
MSGKGNQGIIIDLNQFKLHLNLPRKLELTLFFNSPSRRFYLSIIALIVHEMKKVGKITSIPLQNHLDLISLLNETIGEGAGSSEKKNLSQRIYRKWKDALSNLEAAPLFKVLGKQREHGDTTGRTYSLTEVEKDGWANLFEYRGCEENVRLRFSIDKFGIGLNDVVIRFEESVDGKAWEIFIASLREKTEDKSKNNEIIHLLQKAEPPPFPSAPDRPSIAILPFVNMSSDSEDEHLSDWITEEITTALSKIPDLFVIARTSSFTYKGKSVKVRQVSEDLGVRYIVEGSLRKSENTDRISVQLIDALTDHHIWAERYDLDVQDRFVLLDEITIKILTALQVKLTVGEVAKLWARGTKNLEAFTKVIQAIKNSTRYTKEGVAIARGLAQEAIALDPNYPRAYNVLAQTYVLDVMLGTTDFPEGCLAKALELINKAITLDESNPDSHGQLAYIFTMMREYDKALKEAEEAVRLYPNSYPNLVRLGFVLVNAGKSCEAITVLKNSRRLSPVATIQGYFLNLGLAYFLTGEYGKAVSTAEEGLQQVADDFLLNIVMAASYILMGQKREGRVQAKQVLDINPKFSLKRYAETLYFREKSDVNKMVAALGQAGLE